MNNTLQYCINIKKAANQKLSRNPIQADSEESVFKSYLSSKLVNVVQIFAKIAIEILYTSAVRSTFGVAQWAINLLAYVFTWFLFGAVDFELHVLRVALPEARFCEEETSILYKVAST